MMDPVQTLPEKWRREARENLTVEEKDFISWPAYTAIRAKCRNQALRDCAAELEQALLKKAE